MKRTIFVSICTCIMVVMVALTCGAETSTPPPQTLLTMVKYKPVAAHLADSVLVIIDAQREYVDGKLPLDGIDASLKEASLLLDRARKSGTPVIHVVHRSKAGSPLFNPDAPYVEIAGPVAPRPTEVIVTKTLPNAFAGTDLEEQLSRTGRKNLIVIGYMTHMCVSSTVRAATDRGYRTTVVAKATATRNLPATEGGVIQAQTLQAASLAALADRFAVVVQSARDILE